MLRLISDTHLGVKRKAGTTPDSLNDLRSFMFTKFSELLGLDDDVVVLGDLFDQFTVDTRDVLDTYKILADWLEQCQKHLYLVAGNHDCSSRGMSVSSFELLCHILEGQYPDQVRVTRINEFSDIVHQKVVALAHCSNQDLFDQKLAILKDQMGAGNFLLLHANYANNFAVQSDHSLNVSEEVAAEFCKNGVTLIFAHEHQKRTENPHGTKPGDGLVYILGNQIPSSVADCLGNDVKYYHRLSSDDELTAVPCYQVRDNFKRVDWKEALLDDIEADFIRIEGSAKSSESAEVINTVAKLRNSNNAFIITNSVKVEGMAEIDQLPENFEAAKKFDVVEFVRGHLEPEEAKVFEELVKEVT